MNYFSLAPEYRAYNLDRLVFSATTAFEEDYILPLSYKEFVYGKRSLLEKFESTFVGEGARRHSPKSSTFLDGVKGFWDRMVS